MQQPNLFDYESQFWKKCSREEAITSVLNLCAMHKKGLLGGETMPEDANPGLPINSKDNYHFFTLPMALNYQRNSYTLWASAKQSYEDQDTKDIFIPELVIKMDEEHLKSALVKWKVAIQPVKQTEIWRTICNTVCTFFDGDIRNLFKMTKGYIPDIIEFVQKINKQGFPYLSGPKICNYWLYVIGNYTGTHLTGREALTIAPDTHIIQATIRLGLVSPEDHYNPNIQDIVNKAWEIVLDGTGILPIDIHTPLWLWSRGGFRKIVGEEGL